MKTSNKTKIILIQLKLIIILAAAFMTLGGCAAGDADPAPSSEQELSEPRPSQREDAIKISHKEIHNTDRQIIADYLDSFEKQDTPQNTEQQPKKPENNQIFPDDAISSSLIEEEAAQIRLSGDDEPNMPHLIDPEYADEKVSLNFDEVDIRSMIRTIGDITGTNFIIDDNVQGTVTIISPSQIRLGDIEKVLASILEVKGYAAIPGSGLVKIVPRSSAITQGHGIGIGHDPEFISEHDSLVTQIITPDHARASEIADIAQPLLPREAHMSVYERTNTLIITAGSATVRHIARIINNLDIEGLSSQTKVIELQYASAATLAQQLTEIAQASSATAGRPRQGQQDGQDTKIMPDTRTNSIVLVAPDQKMRQLLALVEKLDVKQPSRAGNVNVIYLENASAQALAESLREALSGLRIAGAVDEESHIQISADEGTNALIVVASAQDYQVIEDIVKKLDIFREQVLVEMMIVEVSQDGIRELGIDWATFDQAVSESIRGFGGTDFGIRSRFEQGQLEGLSVGAWRQVSGDVQIGAILHALDKKSGVNILSTPHILTSNHKTARIVVGENRPFVTRSRITEDDPATPTVVQTFEYKDVGITLEITPHISQGGNVQLEIYSEFTKLIEDVTTDTVGTPITAKRLAETVVSMQSGKTIVIGGLIRDDTVTVEKEVPVVSQVPLVGNLFRFQRDRVEKTNLLMFITPTVLSSAEDMQDMTERKRSEMDSAASQIPN